jgi:hypothetical protein
MQVLPKYGGTAQIGSGTLVSLSFPVLRLMDA